MSKKKVQEFYSAIDEIADKEAFLESVREGFLKIEDPRAKDNQSYRLIDLLIIILRGKQVHLVSAWDSNRSLLLGQITRMSRF